MNADELEKKIPGTKLLGWAALLMVISSIASLALVGFVLYGLFKIFF